MNAIFLLGPKNMSETIIHIRNCFRATTTWSKSQSSP